MLLRPLRRSTSHFNRNYFCYLATLVVGIFWLSTKKWGPEMERDMEKRVLRCSLQPHPSAPRPKQAPPHGTSIKTIVGDPIPGRNKWLGASAFGSTIIGIPSHATSVLTVDPCITPEERARVPGGCRVGMFGKLPRKKRFQWLRGVVAENMKIYGVPCWADSVIQIDPIDREITTIESSPSVVLPSFGEGKKRQTKGTWQWHGGCLGVDGNIYGVPSNADKVLKIDPRSLEISLIGPSFDGQNKWYGGIEGADGRIYCIPYTANRVLRVDPRNQRVELIGSSYAQDDSDDIISDSSLLSSSSSSSSTADDNNNDNYNNDNNDDDRNVNNDNEDVGSAWKWHGGVCTQDGFIIGIPSHAKRVLKIDTRPRNNHQSSGESTKSEVVDGNDQDFTTCRERVSLIGPSLPGCYKWGGGAVGRDGCVYGLPSDLPKVLKVDPHTESVTLIDITGGNDPQDKEHFLAGQKNLWQGAVAVAQTGAIYAIPCDAAYVLKVIPETCEARIIGPELPEGKNKWQGGFLGQDGNIYAIPQNAEHVLKIIPSSSVYSDDEELELIGINAHLL